MSLLGDKIEIEIEEAEIGIGKQLGTIPAGIKWFLIIGVIAIIPTYYVSKAYSHGYWRKTWENFMTTAKASFVSAQDPQTSTTTLFTLSNNSYAAVAIISNPNLDLSLANASYSFNFYDADKKILASFPSSLFLLPNQQIYAVVPKLALTGKPASAGVQFTPPLKWQKRVDIPQVNLTANATSFYNQINPITFTVEGNVFNNSPYSLGSVRLTFLLFDAENNLIGVSSRTEFSLTPFESRAFKQLWPDYYTNNVAKVKIIPITNTLDPENISLPANSGNSASDLGRPTPEAGQ